MSSVLTGFFYIDILLKRGEGMEKDKLLKYFAQRRDEFVSGEELASVFGMSRAGVWKQISALKKAGHEIEGVTNKGYRLLSFPLFEKSISSGISQTTLANYFGEETKISCEVFESINSTNTYVKNAGKSGLHIAVSREQTAGRGRGENEFYSPKGGGIYFSFGFSPKSPHLVTITVAVALADAVLQVTGVQTQIKWVNDLYLEGKKVAGILSEGVFDMEKGEVSRVVCGMGVNISTKDFPESLKEKAGKITDCDTLIDKNLLVSKTINNFFSLLCEGEEIILEKYSKNCLVLGKEITFAVNGKEKRGKAVRITEKGHLVCETEGGEGEVEIASGEVEIFG